MGIPFQDWQEGRIKLDPSQMEYKASNKAKQTALKRSKQMQNRALQKALLESISPKSSFKEFNRNIKLPEKSIPEAIKQYPPSKIMGELSGGTVKAPPAFNSTMMSGGLTSKGSYIPQYPQSTMMSGGLTPTGTAPTPIPPKAFNPSASTVDYGIQTSKAKPPIWETPTINGYSPKNVNPTQIQRNWNSYQTSQLPNIKGVEPRIGNYKPFSVEGLGPRIMNSPITKAISNEIEYAKPFAKAGGAALGIVGAGNLAYGAYQANKDELQTDQIQATKLGNSIKGYQLDNTKPAINVGSFGNPLDNLDYAYRANKVNNDLIQQTSVLPTQQSTPLEAANGYTPIDRKPNAINQFMYPEIQQSPIAQNMSSVEQVQQPQAITQQQIPMDQLPKGSGYVNGKLFDSTKQFTQGMFTGYSKERDASLDRYGKVDKNSDFYKRNKQAMNNVGGGVQEDARALAIQNNIQSQIDADSLSRSNLRHYRFN